MLQMYIKERNGRPTEYRFGESWRATALLVDGGYSTEEEAVLAWAAECGYLKERKHKNVKNIKNHTSD